jgi:hypothetical protein
MRFWLRTQCSKLLAGLLLRLLFTKGERAILAAAVQIVSGNPRIPSFEIGIKRGREYRRDEAAFQAWSGTGLSQGLINLGCELAYWRLKTHKPEVPRKHHHSVSVE